MCTINENDPLKPQKQIQKTNDGKLVLRQAMARLVPPDTLGRVKQGFFTAPDASWFKGESIEFVKAKVLSPRALIYRYMDRGTVAALVDDHLRGRTNRRLFIWSLLVFEEWLAQLAVCPLIDSHEDPSRYLQLSRSLPSGPTTGASSCPRPLAMPKMGRPCWS
jgi:hypothetical protein